MHQRSPKIIELEPVPKGKIGKISKNGIKLESHEEKTIIFLAEHGLDIECLKKNHTPKSKNADIVIFGTIWEMKAPESINKATLKKRMHKASQQADKVIFDLRNIKANYESAEKIVLELFLGNHTLRRMILIKNTGIALDITK